MQYVEEEIRHRQTFWSAEMRLYQIWNCIYILRGIPIGRRFAINYTSTQMERDENQRYFVDSNNNKKKRMRQHFYIVNIQHTIVLSRLFNQTIDVIAVDEYKWETTWKMLIKMETSNMKNLIDTYLSCSSSSSLLLA